MLTYVSTGNTSLIYVHIPYLYVYARLEYGEKSRLVKIYGVDLKLIVQEWGDNVRFLSCL